MLQSSTSYKIIDNSVWHGRLCVVRYFPAVNYRDNLYINPSLPYFLQLISVHRTEIGCMVTGKCYRSQRKSEDPYNVKVMIKNNSYKLKWHNVVADIILFLVCTY